MDKPKMVQAMRASISEVLEQMFFLPIDIVETDDEENPMNFGGQRPITVSVVFDGPSSGVFVLRIPSSLAESITADFLGAPPDDLSEEQVTGTVKEMLNMLAGNSLSAYDAQAIFNLKIPKLVTASMDPAPDDRENGRIVIGIETMDSRMMLHMES